MVFHNLVWQWKIGMMSVHRLKEKINLVFLEVMRIKNCGTNQFLAVVFVFFENECIGHIQLKYWQLKTPHNLKKIRK